MISRWKVRPSIKDPLAVGNLSTTSKADFTKAMNIGRVVPSGLSISTYGRWRLVTLFLSILFDVGMIKKKRIE